MSILASHRGSRTYMALNSLRQHARNHSHTLITVSEINVVETSSAIDIMNLASKRYNISPNIVMYTLIIDNHIKHGRIMKAVSSCEKIETAIIIDARIYEITANGFAILGDIPRVDECPQKSLAAPASSAQVRPAYWVEIYLKALTAFPHCLQFLRHSSRAQGALEIQKYLRTALEQGLEPDRHLQVRVRRMGTYIRRRKGEELMEDQLRIWEEADTMQVENYTRLKETMYRTRELISQAQGWQQKFLASLKQMVRSE